MTNHNSALSIIIGEQLSSVEFVLKDYVQLRFDGPCLNAYNWPIIKFANQIFKTGMPGYCDALCELITHKVINASASEHDKILIEFEDNNSITISLHSEDYRSVEAAELNYTDNYNRPHVTIW